MAFFLYSLNYLFMFATVIVKHLDLKIMTNIEFNARITGIKESLENYSMYLTRNKEDAEDLLQDTFVKALTNKNKFDPSTNIKTWTYVIMKNTFINNYRKAQRQKTLVDATPDYYHINTSSAVSSVGPDYEFERKEIMQKVREIDNEQDSVFTMNLEGYKYKEIAEKTNLPIGTVKSRIFLTRKKLSSRYNEYTISSN